MELLKLHRRKSRLSDVAYIALNIGLAVAVLIAILATQNIWLALVIALVSKWRIFAVRPRFWRQNIMANLVDIIVGVGHVIFLFAASGQFGLQIFLTVGYIAWLLFIKPRSKRLFVTAQASAALFVGTSALSMLVYRYDTALLVIGMLIIGYVCARHVLVNYEYPDATFLSLVWALLMAELAWFGHSWLFAYSLPNTADLKLSQLALVATLLGFLAEKALASRHKHGDVRLSDMIGPGIFSLGLIAILVLFFNRLLASGAI